MIDRLIKENQCFALYRLPLENHIHFLRQRNRFPEFLYRIQDLNNSDTFIIAPFQSNIKQPIILISPDIEEILPIPDNAVINEPNIAIDQLITKDYELHFSTFKEALKEDTFRKLVLSRKKEIKKESTFSPEEAFYTACRKYIYSYVYICHTPQTGTWLGCTPEILLAGRNKQWQTVALAGTQPLQQGETPAGWDEKNQQEQKMVSTYIQELLNAYQIQFKEKGPYAVKAGRLAHLKTDFHFTLPENYHIGSLINDLHPTPAVCGLPKEEAKQFILDNEGYERSYYSGFIGRLQPGANTDIYVNLRCMQIHEHQLTLYAGGGILPSSSLEDEWMETENKLQTMLTLTKTNVHR